MQLGTQGIWTKWTDGKHHFTFLDAMKEKRKDSWLVYLFCCFFPPKLYEGMWQTPNRRGRGTYRSKNIFFKKNNLKSCFPCQKTVKYQQQHIPHRLTVLEKRKTHVFFFKCQPAPVLTLLFLSLLKFPTPSPAGSWVMFCRWAPLCSQLCSSCFCCPFCSTLWSSLTHLQNFGCQLKTRT